MLRKERKTGRAERPEWAIAHFQASIATEFILGSCHDMASCVATGLGTLGVATKLGGAHDPTWAL